MKILCISDIHGRRDLVTRIEQVAHREGIKHVFILGDYSASGTFNDTSINISDVNYVLDLLKDFKVFSIPGNCDAISITDVFEKLNSNFHKKFTSIECVDFLGLGGSNITPFETPYEFDESEIYDSLQKLYDDYESSKPLKSHKGECKDVEQRVVLASHTPPYNTACDLVGGGAHVGSRSLRKIIEEKKPDLVICGHIHEQSGISGNIGKTRVINVGTFAKGAYSILDTETLDVDARIL